MLSSYTPKLIESSVYYKTFSDVLTVSAISAEYLIAMKLKSGRRYKNDISDMVGIASEHWLWMNLLLLLARLALPVLILAKETSLFPFNAVSTTRIAAYRNGRQQSKKSSIFSLSLSQPAQQSLAADIFMVFERAAVQPADCCMQGTAV